MISTNVRIRLVAALAATVFLVSACANDGDSDAAAGDSGSDGAAGATATGSTGEDDATGGAYGGGGGTDDDAGMGGDVTVQANNFLFAPRDIEVAAGTEITVRNGNASTPHTFTVEGTDLDLEVSPLETETAKVELDPGTYDFQCRFHGQMTGTLTVT